jgi:hypothetical protein
MANSYLNKTFGTPTDTKKYTMSVWVKRSSLGVQQSIARSTNGSDDSHVFTFNSDDSLRWDEYGSSASIGVLKTNRKFRDTSAWYHVVLWYDSANSTAGDRMRMWINGVEETSFATDTNPSINAASAFNKASQPINIGRTSYGSGGNYFDGYLSHMAFVDGLNVAHTTFGETDSTSGIWKFKSPSGVTWGTNGFHLKFENSAALGTDSSGNTNTFTVNGNLKQALDTPSNVYATMNSLGNYVAATTLTNGNNTVAMTNSKGGNLSTLACTGGKYYAEMKVATMPQDGRFHIGIMPHPVLNADDPINTGNNGIMLSGFNAVIYANSGSGSAVLNNFYGNATGRFSGTPILGCAVDLSSATKTMAISINGAWITGSNTTDASFSNALKVDISTPVALEDDWFFGCGSGNGSGTTGVYNWNFGNGFFGTTAITSAGSNGNGSLFEYDVPSGYYALNTKNINTYG